MKCTCGRDRAEGSILCRMVEVRAGLFRAEIYDGEDALLAKSEDSLSPKEALDFIDSAAQRDSFSRHFHWERLEKPQEQYSGCFELKVC